MTLRDLLDERGEMKTVDLRRLAPFLEHQLGHGGRLEQVEKKPIEERRVLLRLVFFDVDANDRGLAFLSPASAQPLGQASSPTRRTDLSHELDVAHVDPHLQGARAKRGGGLC